MKAKAKTFGRKEKAVVAFVDEALSRAPVVCDLSSPLQILQCDTHSAKSFSTCCLIDFNLAFSTSVCIF